MIDDAQYQIAKLFSVPDGGLSVAANLAVKLKETVKECFCCRWASWHVQVDGNNSVATSDDAVRVVVVTTTVRTRTHGDDPSWLRHLVVYFAKSWSHLVGQSTGNNHAVRLTGRCTENNTQSILIVSGSGDVHHLYGTACQTERHGPETRLSSPVCHLVHRTEHILGTVPGRFE